VTYAKGTLLEMHNHATEQILYLQSGRYRVTVEGVDYLMGAGDVIVFPSYSLHEIEALEDSAHIATFAPGALPE
jgi:quercetin dioxygenase-like cupin family protein